MTTAPSIGSGQFFCLLFLSSGFLAFSVPGNSASALPFLAPVSFFLALIAALLLRGLHRTRCGNLLDCTRAVFPVPFAVAAAILYLLYFLFCASSSAAQYDAFLRTELLPNTSSFRILFVLCAAAAYAAWSGLEALARSAAFLFACTLAVFLLLFSLLSGKIDVLNFSPIQAFSPDSILSGGIRLVGQLPELALMLLLFPASHRPERAVRLWVLSLLALLICCGFWLTGVFGPLADRLTYPFYDMAELAELGKMQRWDALCLAIWSFSVFIRVALLLYGAGACVRSFLGAKAAQCTVLAGGGVVCIVSTLFSRNPDWYLSLQPAAFSVFAFVLFLLIPLLVLALHPKKAPTQEDSP